MEKFTKHLLAQLRQELQKIALGSENAVQRAERSFFYAETIMKELKDFLTHYEFKSEADEILFFKKIKPDLQKELIYFEQQYYIEASKPVSVWELQKQYYKQALDRLQSHFDENRCFYIYYQSGATHFDQTYFLRSGNTVSTLPVSSLDLDTSFSTPYSCKLAKFMAYEQLGDHLNTLINNDNAFVNTKHGNNEHKHSVITWTDSKSALIELIYALCARGSVNFGKIEMKPLVNALEMFFDVKLGNFYRVYMSMLIRKNSRTTYLDTLKESLEKRMDDADL